MLKTYITLTAATTLVATIDFLLNLVKNKKPFTISSSKELILTVLLDIPFAIFSFQAIGYYKSDVPIELAMSTSILLAVFARESVITAVKGRIK